MMAQLMLLGVLQVTSYRSVPQQTDSTPFITSIGERVAKGGIAVSQDMLCPLTRYKKNHAADKCLFSYSHLPYKDALYVEKFGLHIVNDVMHKRHKKAVDIWVESYPEEKAVGKQLLQVGRL